MTDLDPEARRLVDLTREARSPTLEDKARIERLLGAAMMLGSATAHGATGGAATKVVGTTLATKWVGVALIAVVGGAGYASLRAMHSAPREVPVPAAVVAAAANMPEPEPAEEPVVVTATPKTAEGEAPAAAPRSGVRALHAKAPGTLPEELDLLHEAQSKWRSGNASAALSLLEQHRKRYPQSQLGPERDALTVLSLCATNREAAATRIAHRFLQNAPRSPLRTSVEQSCGGK